MFSRALDNAVQPEVGGQGEDGVHDGGAGAAGGQGGGERRSTFTELTGRVARYRRLEYPVPKSSMAIPTLESRSSVNCRIVEEPDSGSTDSVNSRIKSVGSRWCLANAQRTTHRMPACCAWPRGEIHRHGRRAVVGVVGVPTDNAGQRQVQDLFAQRCELAIYLVGSVCSNYVAHSTRIIWPHLPRSVVGLQVKAVYQVTTSNE